MRIGAQAVKACPNEPSTSAVPFRYDDGPCTAPPFQQKLRARFLQEVGQVPELLALRQPDASVLCCKTGTRQTSPEFVPAPDHLPTPSLPPPQSASALHSFPDDREPSLTASAAFSARIFDLRHSRSSSFPKDTKQGGRGRSRFAFIRLAGDGRIHHRASGFHHNTGR